MLAALSIRDIVLIDKLDLEFGEGLSALTGETGAGKSLVATAIHLLLGRKSTPDIVRRGAAEAEVEEADADVEIAEEEPAEFMDELEFLESLSLDDAENFDAVSAMLDEEEGDAGSEGDQPDRHCDCH